MAAGNAWSIAEDEVRNSTAIVLSSFKLGPPSLRPYQPFEVTFTISNAGDRDLRKLWVSTQVNRRFFSSPVLRSTKVLESLPLDDEKNICLPIKFRHDPNIFDFRFYPLSIPIAVEEEEESETETGNKTRILLIKKAVPLNAELLLPRLKSFGLPDGRRANILLFGDTLTGKTTLLKTMISALSGELALAPAGVSPVGNHPHVTQMLYRVQITSGLNVLDTWGSYEREDVAQASRAFRYLVAGGLPVAWGREKRIRVADPSLLQQLARHTEMQPDVVFFTVSSEIAQQSATAAAYVKRMQRYISILNQERPGMPLYGFRFCYLVECRPSAIHRLNDDR